MKLTLEKSALLKALAHSQGVIEKRNTVPILANILCSAEGDSLSLTSTDLELALIETVPAGIEEKGAFTVSAQLLYDVVRKLKDQLPLHLSLEDDRLHIASGTSNFHLPCLPVADFPPMVSTDLPYEWILPVEGLKALIDRTRFAMSLEETRYDLNGIYFHKTMEGHLRAVATDGHRLALTQFELPKDAGDFPSIILSRKTITELRKLCEEAQGHVQIRLSDSQASFNFGSAILYARLVEGQYPDYEAAIPQGNGKLLTVHAKDFQEAVDRVSVIANDKTKVIKLHLGEGSLGLSSTMNEIGSSKESLEVSYEDQSFSIGFNARYVLDVAQHISHPEMHFYLEDEATPALIRDGSDENTLYVLMPMRV